MPMRKKTNNDSYKKATSEKERFLDRYKQCKDEMRVLEELGLSNHTLWVWLRNDKEFANQLESYKNGAKHKLRAKILAKALQGSVTKTYEYGDLVKEVHYTDPSLLKLAHQIINSDDFDHVKQQLPAEMKIVFNK